MRQSYQTYKNYNSNFKAAPGLIDFRDPNQVVKSYNFDQPPQNLTIVNKKSHKKRSSL